MLVEKIKTLLAETFKWDAKKTASFLVIFTKIQGVEKLKSHLETRKIDADSPELSTEELIESMDATLQELCFRDKPTRIIKKLLETIIEREVKDVQERFQMEDQDLSIKKLIEDIENGKEKPSYLERKKALDTLVELRDCLFDSGFIHSAPLTISSCTILAPLGAALGGAKSRIVNAQELLNAGKIEPQFIFLLGGQRPLPAAERNAAQGEELGKCFYEIQVMEGLAKKYLGSAASGKYQQKIVAVNAPMRDMRDGKGKPTKLVLDKDGNPVLDKQDRAFCAEDPKVIAVRPDTSYTLFCAAQEIAKKLAAGQINAKEKITILCLSESPNFGTQLQQAKLGLEQALLEGILPQEIFNNIEVLMTGPKRESIPDSTKTVTLDLSAIAGEFRAHKLSFHVQKELKKKEAPAAVPIVHSYQDHSQSTRQKLDKREEKKDDAPAEKPKPKRASS